MKKTLALLLALCMAFSMFSVVAFAESSATLNVAIVDDNGQAVTEIKAGESVWAVISVANYADYVGDAAINWDADDLVTESEYDNAIAVVTTYLELDTDVFAAATDDNGLVWESPYKSDIEGQSGTMEYNQDGNYLKTLLQTDCEGGVFYSIGKSDLDANNGELYRIKLVAADDAAVGTYSVGLYGGDGITAPGLATISSAAGEATVTTADVPVAMGAAAPIAIYSDDVAVELPENYTIVDATEGFVYDNWTLTNSKNSTTGLTITTAEGDKGTYGLEADYRAAADNTLTYNDAYYFDGVDVNFEGTVYFARYTNNNLRDGATTYGGVKLGDLEFRMSEYHIPQIWYNGEKIAQGEPAIPTYYVMGEDGEYALDDTGAKIVATDAEGVALYENWAAYIEAVKVASMGSDGIVTYGIDVVDGVVTGYIVVNGAKADKITADLPAGAFAEAVKASVIMSGATNYAVAGFNGAKLVAEKVITDIAKDAYFANTFSSDIWTRNGTLIETDTEYGDFIHIQKGTMTATTVNTYNLGDEFHAGVNVLRQYYNRYDGEYTAVKVGDLTVKLVTKYDGGSKFNTGAGEENIVEIYKGETLLATSDAVAMNDDAGAREAAGKGSEYHVGAALGIDYVDGVATATVNGNVVATAEADLDLSAVTMTITQVNTDWSNSINYNPYLYDKFAFAKVDLGATNAYVEAFVDRGNYANVPEYMITAANVGDNLTADQQAILTAENVQKAKDYIELAAAYESLGSVTLSDYILQNFSEADWTKAKGAFKTDATYGDYLLGKDNTDLNVTSKNTYDLDDEFHFGVTYGKLYYNTKDGYNFKVAVGDFSVVVVPTSVTDGKIQGPMNATVYNGETVLGTVDGNYFDDTVFNTTTGVATDHSAAVTMDYVDGVLTVAVNDTVIFSGAAEADLTAAAITVADEKLTGWASSVAYSFYLYTATREVNLFDLNVQLGELANVTDWKTYSSVAADADAIIPQLSADKLEAMYNLPIYEAYKEAYATAAKGITYNLINGFYDYEWTDVKTVGGYLVRGDEEIAYQNEQSELAYKTVSYPDTALYMENVRDHQTMKSKVALTTPGYFKITYQGEGIYYNDRYIQWTVGDLAIRSTCDAPNPSPEDTDYKDNVVFEIMYKGEVIKTITGVAVEGVDTTVDGCSLWMYANCKFTITYDNGNLKITFYNGATKYVTAKEGLDLTALVEGFNYDPNGNHVELDVYTSYSMFAVKNVTVTGKVNNDAIAALDALAVSDPAAAKLVYNSLSDKSVVSAETKALLDTEFAVSAEEGLSYTYTIDGTTDTAYRYGDTLILVGEGTDELGFGGWFDAEGNLLSTDKEYAVVVAPGVTVVAKGCVHEAGETVNAKDPTCGEEGYTGDVLCALCGCVMTEGEAIPATGEHAWGEFVANEDGLTETRTCGTCGATETQDIEIEEECTHEWSEWEITTEATSTTPGVKTRTCGLCSATETQEYTIETSGTSGDVTWRFEDGTLYIEGTGAMGDYINAGDGVAPWQSLRVEIEHVVIGDQVTRIGNRAFKNLNKTKTVTFGKSVVEMGYECFQGCTQLASVSINEGLTAIGAHAFYDCAFESVTIPSTVTALENRAFKNCKKLTSVDIPNSVTTTGYEIFMGCTSLASVDYTTGCATINPHAFEGCTSLTDFYVPANVVRIRTQAFEGCTALATITFEDDDKLYGSSTEAKIASDSFAGCPSTLTFKGWMSGNASLYASQKGFQFEATNTSIFKYTLDANNNATITGMRGEYSTVNIPATVDGYTVVAIGNQSIRDNTIVKKVVIPETVTTIGGRAFQGCTNLATVEGMANVTKIDYNAFANCAALSSISFGDALTSIGANAFQNCSSLGEIYVPNTVTTVNNTAFTGCTNATIKTQENSPAAKAAAAQSVAVKIVTCFDYTVNADGESVTVTGVLGNVTELVIPDTIAGYKVTVINQRICKNNTALTSIVIGNNVTDIKYEAFMNCTSLKTVEIGTGVATIGSKAFGGLTSIESFTIRAESAAFHSGTFTDTVKTMVINGVAGSTAETFAGTKGFTFVAL